MDTRVDDDMAALMNRTSGPAVPNRRPRTPCLVAADKPRLKTASCASDPAHSHIGVVSVTAGSSAGHNALTTSAVEPARVPAGALAGRMTGNMLDSPFCFEREGEAPIASNVAMKATGVEPSKPAERGGGVPATDHEHSPPDSDRTGSSSSSSHSHDLNSSFRQFMVDRLHEAHVAGKPVDSSNVSHKKSTSRERSEQSRAKAAAEQLLAGIRKAELCKSQSLALHGAESDVGVGQDTVDRVSETGVDNSARVLENDPESSREASSQLQQSNKIAEAGEGNSFPGDLPEEDVIGVALMAAAAASAAGENLQFDAHPRRDCGDESGLMYTATERQSSEGVLHTFVADRLILDRTGMSKAQCQAKGSAAAMDMRPDTMDVQQHKESGVDNAASGVVGAIYVSVCPRNRGCLDTGFRTVESELETIDS